MLPVRTDAVDWERAPGAGRYARVERERRFLLSALPAGLAGARTIDDRYVVGTRLRLRRVHDGRATVFKLGQKVRPDDGDPARVMVTNMYLTEAEYAVLAALPAAVLSKTRRLWDVDGHTFAVDEFSGLLRGLLLAEVEVDDLAAAVPVRSPVVREVTSDDRFSGGRLAHTTPGEAAELLRDAAELLVGLSPSHLRS